MTIAGPKGMRILPTWVTESPYMNANDLAILSLDSSDVLTRTGDDRPTNGRRRVATPRVQQSRRELTGPGNRIYPTSYAVIGSVGPSRLGPAEGLPMLFWRCRITVVESDRAVYSDSKPDVEGHDRAVV